MSSYNKNHPESIQKMFNKIASRYDVANALMSFNLHKVWNRKLIQTLQNSYDEPTLLDLCSGTGDIAFEFLRGASKPTTIYLLDFSSEMLEVAKAKAEKYGSGHDRIECIHADAQEIPLHDASVPNVTVAYGIRNVKDPLKCFKDVYRVLKPGGQFAILELTQPESVYLRFFHKIYLKTFLPLVGRMITPDKEAYNYLCNSIQSFIRPKQIVNLLLEAGFNDCKKDNLLGGTATIFYGRKPDLP